MKDFDKNFHINFSPLYFVIAFMFLMLWASEANASDIEEVIVVGQQEEEIEVDPVANDLLIDAILPEFTWNAGGYGGFIGYNERGAQTVHTSVLVNGIPANDPGASWYDFGHDIATGQTVKVISGANGVLYGSGSIAGTVLIQDTIDKGALVKFQDGLNVVRVAPVEQFEFSMVDDSMGSVRNDNDEKDTYKNKSARFNVDLGDFYIVGKYVDYDYDYDNCYGYSWNQSNDCLQDGERYNISIRNDFITVGRNYNSADYYTENNPTYANESYRDFLRLGEQRELSKNLYVAYGVDAEKVYYNTNSWQNVEGSVAVETEITEPGIYFAEDDVNKSRPLWTGEYITTGEFDTSYTGDGIFTLTQTPNKYTDENAGAYISVNAKLMLEYNIGIRYGNDGQNALRLGIKSGEWFFNVGSSFRKPNLYELHGDGYVLGNLDLEPEEGIGYEFGYGAITLFRYEFTQSIEYQPGYTTDFETISIELDSEATLAEGGPGVGCVLNPNWTENDAATFEIPGCVYKNVTNTTSIWNDPTYENTGEYISQGIRYSNTFGIVDVDLKWTDTEQTRVPEYSGALNVNYTYKKVDLRAQYVVNLNRKPSEYDVIEDEFLEDLEKLNIYATTTFDNGLTFSIKVENLTNNVVEVVPFYNSNEREVSVILDYKW